MDKAKSVYDTPSKGILWGWEVSAYVWTKAISAGAFLFPFIGWLLGYGDFNNSTSYTSVIIGLIFLMLTGLLLIKDLDQPKRFAYVLLRPQWKSWLVKGGYSITIYGGLLSVLALLSYMNWDSMVPLFRWLTFGIGMIVAVYTAFLFAQSKGRDFWQSPTLSIHMVIHSIMAGAAIYGIINVIFPIESGILPFISIALIAGIIINVFTIASELMTTHPTLDAATTVTMITKGRYKNLFWFGVMFVGNILPFVLLLTIDLSPVMMGVIGIMVLIGIYCTEHIWVEAPQRIPLS